MQWGSAYPSEVIMSSAPSEAWRFLWGGSPYRARSRQPPVPSGALGEEERQPRTNQVKRTQGTLEAGRVTAHPEVWYSLVRACKQTATVVTHRKPLQRHHDGEMPEGLSGSSGPGMQREKREELGRASGLLGTGRPPRPPGGRSMVQGQSNHLRVCGGRESRPQGKGGDGGTEPSQDTCAGHAGPKSTSQPP
jgi:hypothetical protein